MLALCLCLLSGVTPPPLVLRDRGMSGPVRPDALAYYSAMFANQLRAQGVKVISGEEGDSEAEVKGVLARFGEDGMQVTLSATAPDGTVVAVRNFTARDEAELFEVLRAAAQELAAELFKRFEKMPVPQVQETMPPEPLRPTSTTPGLVVAALGAVVLAGGAALDVHAWSLIGAVRDGAPVSYPAARSQASGAKSYSTIGVVLLAVGGAMAVGGLAYSFTVLRANRALLRVAPVPTRGGGAMLLSGEF